MKELRTPDRGPAVRLRGSEWQLRPPETARRGVRTLLVAAQSGSTRSERRIRTMDNTRFIKEGDVRKVIEDSTYTTTLRDLERRGKSKVRVVKARQIYRLIAEAVNQVVAGASLEMAEDERERLVEESRKELDRILGEHNREEEKFREQQRNIERHLRREVEGCLERIAELRADDEQRIGFGRGGLQRTQPDRRADRERMRLGDNAFAVDVVATVLDAVGPVGTGAVGGRRPLAVP